MLAHPAFAAFAEDLSNDPNILASTTATSTSTTSATSSSTTVKQESTKSSSPKQQAQDQSKEQQQQKQQPQQQTMRQDSMDFSMLNLGNSHWGINNFQQPTVMAVYELPSPSLPSISAISGKTDVLEEIFKGIELPAVMPAPKAGTPSALNTLESAEDVAAVELIRMSSCEVEDEKDDQKLIDEINAAFDLFEAQIQILSVTMGCWK
jgi:flagellum-specific peptidoglycan hydrolase FlgJ